MSTYNRFYYLKKGYDYYKSIGHNAGKKLTGRGWQARAFHEGYLLACVGAQL